MSAFQEETSCSRLCFLPYFLQRDGILQQLKRLLALLSKNVSSEVAVFRDKGAVLGLARTGLIFTGLQEGAQPGGGG